MATELPDELYIEIFKLTGENPLRFRVSKHFQKIILGQFPFTDVVSVAIINTFICFNRKDLLQLFRGLRNYPELHYYPIIRTIIFGTTSMLRTLLFDWRVDPSAKDNHAIKLASLCGKIDAVRLLLSDPRVDPNAVDDEMINDLLADGQKKIVELLPVYPKDYRSENNNLLIIHASQTGCVPLVKLLLSDPRVDPSTNDNYAIKEAYHNGHTEVVKLLSENRRVRSTIDVYQFLKK